VYFDVIEVMVFDEVDYMVDLGFLLGVKWLFDKMFKGMQCLLFFVMFDNGIDVLVKWYLSDFVMYLVELK